MLENLPDFVGHALRDQRAGLDQIAFRRLPLRGGQGAIAVASLAFVDHGPLPALYTADGEGRSPPIHWSGVPAAATSVALVVEDADSPTPHPLVHAIAVGLPSGDGSLTTGALDGGDAASAEAPDATRTCSTAGCRPTRRPGTARIAMPSRCSRSPATSPCPIRQAATPCLRCSKRARSPAAC